jgi:hypothetical protein
MTSVAVNDCQATGRAANERSASKSKRRYREHLELDRPGREPGHHRRPRIAGGRASERDRKAGVLVGVPLNPLRLMAMAIAIAVPVLLAMFVVEVVILVKVFDLLDLLNKLIPPS